jgi:hypothetical protein
MIRFHLRLVARSTRWLAPTLLAAIWSAFTVASPGPALGNASGSFIMLVAVTCWITVAIGNVDDDGHRELVAAAAGSPARLHRWRALTAYVGANVLALAVTVAGIASGTSATRPVGAARVDVSCVLLELAATAIGVGLGTLLHRPVLRNSGVGVLVAIGGLVGVILLPPVQHVLRQLNDDRTGGLVPLTLAALALGGLCVALSGALAARLN